MEKELAETTTKKQRLIDAIMNGCYAKEINDEIDRLNKLETLLQKKIVESKFQSIGFNENAIKTKIRSLICGLNKNIDLIVKEFVACVIAHKNNELDIYNGISKTNGRASYWLPR